MSRLFRLAALRTALLLALCALPAAGRELSGEVGFAGETGEDRPDVRQAVVYFEPDAPIAAAVGTTASPSVMTTRNKAFEPLVVTVAKGGSVRFPNQDPILHNVFSVSPGNAFDLGLYSRGPGEAREFKNSGVVRVFCNVHHSMVGYVMVVETPHHVSPDARGRFHLTGIPQGSGRLMVWHPQAEIREVRISNGVSGPIEIHLEVTRRRVPPHLNKFGKSYKKGRRGRYN